MHIQDMFAKDINRYINGVVSVGEEDTAYQELEEYVVTRELQNYFDKFYEAYERGLDNPARNVGVWIQGYFGSGKSHFLKMLSYLLENREVRGKRAVSYFENKFSDPMTFAKIEHASRVTAETILFNIDVLGGGYKEGETAKTAVMHSFAHAFYNHLGFYGRNYKIARFEKALDDLGKTAEFRAAYEEITEIPWLEDRKNHGFRSFEIAEAASRVAGMSEQSVTEWAEASDDMSVDFGELVDDINEYAAKREAEVGGPFRLLFMVDEMGQYLNSDVNLMLNLQTLVEQFCDKCNGRVWMVVSSQEAIDEMMTVVGHDFSKIQGRFSTRIRLSSADVSEVIRRRVLDKTPEARTLLEAEHEQKSAVLKNLFAFEDSRGDLHGYASQRDFVESFPFVGYQFQLMPGVLAEIRKHGYQGKSLSTGERSMLSAYQEAAQAVEGGTETSLVPFWRFFDTLEKELDHGIKQVFERCRRAAEGDYAIRPEDLNVLKVLYLINYLSDVKPTLSNIAILMVDDMEVDKVALREQVKGSLDRLVKENYVARVGERYSFLTDEEQDVAREIRDEQVDPSAVIEAVKHVVFDGIYHARRYRKGSNDFPLDRYVDDTIHGASQGGMKLNVITMAYPGLPEADDALLDLRSMGQALVVLPVESDYYDVLYNAAKIRKYTRTHSRDAMSETKRRIVEGKAREAGEAEQQARGLIEQAILQARVSVDGHAPKLVAATAKQKTDAALDKLVDAVFSKAGLVDASLASDAQLREILAGRFQRGIDSVGGNQAAAEELSRYLESNERAHLNTTMGDIQRHFQGEPYGWRELDVAGVVALLLADQKLAVAYKGEQLPASNSRMPDLLRKQTEVDKLVVRKRRELSASLLATSRSTLRELDRTASVPNDEDGLVAAVKECLSARADSYTKLLTSFYSAQGDRYPGRAEVAEAVRLAKEVLAQGSDAEAFLRAFNAAADDLLDNADDLREVEEFFPAQQRIFDDALALVSKMQTERVYVEGNAEVQAALAKVKEILALPKPYQRVKELPDLCKAVDEVYGRLVKEKRNDLLHQLDAALGELKRYAHDEGGEGVSSVQLVLSAADDSVLARRDDVHKAQTCSRLDALSSQIVAWQEGQLRRIDAAIAGNRPVKPVGDDDKPEEPKVKVLSRAALLPAKSLRNEAEVDAYVAHFRRRLLEELAHADSIRLGQ